MFKRTLNEMRRRVNAGRLTVPAHARDAMYDDDLLAADLPQLQTGDLSMLASPMKDSYHTVWFEFHEELIALSGRDRAEEERAHGG